MRDILLPDIHLPWNIRLDPIFEFIEDFKPDRVILMGDAHDWGAVSDWVSDQSRALDHGIIQQNFAELRQLILDPLLRAIPKNCKIIYLEGNHEHWLTIASSINPNGRGYWGLSDNLDLKKYRMTIVSINVPFKASHHLYYIHGVYTNEYHAKKTVTSYQKSILYGHTHDRQEYCLVSPIDASHVNKGASIGCLCNRNPLYLRNKPNRWVNGFDFVYIDDKTGVFQDTFVYIIGGRFWANNRRYS